MTMEVVVTMVEASRDLAGCVWVQISSVLCGRSLGEALVKHECMVGMNEKIGRQVDREFGVRCATLTL